MIKNCARRAQSQTTNFRSIVNQRLQRTGAPNPPARRSPTQRDHHSLTTAQTVAGGATKDDKCETCARTHSQLRFTKSQRKPTAFAVTLEPTREGANPVKRAATTRIQNNTTRSAATWLILPVVICLSQRLSHACLSISIVQRNCRRLIKTVMVYLMVHCYLDNRSNSRANTCTKGRLTKPCIY